MSFRFLTCASLVTATTFAADAPRRCCRLEIQGIDLSGHAVNAATA